MLTVIVYIMVLCAGIDHILIDIVNKMHTTRIKNDVNLVCFFL